MSVPEPARPPQQDRFHGSRTATVQTSFGPNVTRHDYTGHAGDARTDGGGAVTIGIPPDDNGTVYVAYSRGGFGCPVAVLPARATQNFEGAADVDTGRVTNDGALDVGRIWHAADSAIEAALHAGPAPWGTPTQLLLDVVRCRGYAGAAALLDRRAPGHRRWQDAHAGSARPAPEGQRTASAARTTVRTQRDLFRPSNPGVSHARRCHHPRL